MQNSTAISGRKTRNDPNEFPHVALANKYIAGVLDGSIPACRWVKLACERHKRDLLASARGELPYLFDPFKVERVCRFVEMLPHVKGKWARLDPVTMERRLLVLEPWQCFILASIFGWVSKLTGFRRFQKARIYVPRKNGKSFLAAAIGLYMAFADDEPGAEVYSGATSEKQAWEVFRPAKEMSMAARDLIEGLEVTIAAQSLVREYDHSRFLPIIGKPGDGASPHCAIIDEYHEHKTSELIDTMATGMGAREQPLELVISTAGADMAGPCREDWKACERLLENAGGFEDEQCFCIIYTIDQDDKWDCEEALRKANPNWNVSIIPDRLLAELKVAKQAARKQSAFKTKYLNLWVTAKEGYFNVLEWEMLARDIHREQFKEFPCFIAGDLASKHDLVALMQLFVLPDNRFAVFGKYFLPAAAIERPENQHYRVWQSKGLIEAAGEETVDYENYKDDARALCEAYQVVEFPYDPNRAWGVMTQLENEGLPVIEYRNTVLTMSEPMKELDALIRDGRIIHNGDPVLTWAMANVTGKEDKKENVYPNKEDKASKIDPVVSLLMALGRAMTHRSDEPGGPMFSW